MGKSAKIVNKQAASVAAGNTPEVPGTSLVLGDGGQGEQSPGITEEQKHNAVDAEWLAEKIEPYLVHYPGEKVFHITNDGQVFLDGNKMCAVDHQRTIAPGVDVINFNVE